MAGKQHFIILLCLILASCGFGAIPVEVEIVEVNRIWDKAPHNAFTDLARWQDAFYCAFREGRGHVSTDGRIRILESKDADTWKSAASISLEGYDLRDAHLSVAPDGRLMLLGGAAPREKDNQSVPTGTFVSFSKDGRQWTEPQIAVEPGRWLWCVTWNQGKAYGVSYTAGQGAERYLDLLISDDGIHYTPHVPRLLEQGYPTEVTLRFDSEGTCYALVRRDRRGDDPSSALLGISQADYKQWQWKDLGTEFNGFGGPNFIQIPGGFWLAAGRMHDGGAHTALCYLDVESGTMTKLAKLPSGGDTSYPGMVWYNGMLYVSYYSSHEGKTSIYLAKLKIHTSGVHKITGVVRDEKGEMVSDALLYVLPHVSSAEKRLIMFVMTGRYATTDSMGMCEVRWQPGMFTGKREDELNVYTRYINRNLVAVTRLEKESETLDITLKEGIILAGQVVDLDGNFIPAAKISFRFWCRSYGFRFDDQAVTADEQGRYKIRALWPEHRYNVTARADGYGTLSVSRYCIDDALNHTIELEPLVLRRANLLVSGVVVDVDDNPVADAKVSCSGKGQSSRSTQTDASGRFKLEGICAGEVLITASIKGKTRLYGVLETEGGSTDVKLVLRERSSSISPSVQSLVGKALPELIDLKIEPVLAGADDRIVLVCFFDMNQRPSRNCIMQLAKQSEHLKEKGVTVFTVHASNVNENTLDEWIKKNNIPFSVGIIRGDEKKTRFNWGVKSLPWLILTNRRHIVTAEGFGLDELADKIRQTGDGK